MRQDPALTEGNKSWDIYACSAGWLKLKTRNYRSHPISSVVAMVAMSRFGSVALLAACVDGTEELNVSNIELCLLVSSQFTIWEQAQSELSVVVF